MKRPVPEADPVAYARMKYELENRTKPGMMSKCLGPVQLAGRTPAMAAKSGSPQMTGFRPTIPASVPPSAAVTPTGVTRQRCELSVSPIAIVRRSTRTRTRAPRGSPGELGCGRHRHRRHRAGRPDRVRYRRRHECRRQRRRQARPARPPRPLATTTRRSGERTGRSQEARSRKLKAAEGSKKRQ